MKAYLAIKYLANHQNRAVIETLSGILEQAGYATICVARDLEKWGQVHFTPADLMRHSFAAINASDVVVIELTEKGVGVGIEAGYAWANQKPILTIARQGADISETLQGISQRVCRYRELAELADFFAQPVNHSA